MMTFGGQRTLMLQNNLISATVVANKKAGYFFMGYRGKILRTIFYLLAMTIAVANTLSISDDMQLLLSLILYYIYISNDNHHR
jgi:hypothetical protein